MLLDKIYKEILNQTSLSNLKKKKILLAVSGGIDSVFLYYILKEISIKYDFIISLAHVNYNSNQNSQDAMRLCLKLAEKYKHIFYLRNNYFSIRKNYESKARDIRYKFFKNIQKVEGYDYIATGHNKNDLIETLYMQNKNKDDISIIPFSNINNKIIRPLLGINRKTIKDYIVKKKYIHIEDLSNLDTSLKRNHIRLKILPNYKNIDLIENELLEIYRIKTEKMKLFKKALDKYLKYISFDDCLNKIKIDRSIFILFDIYMMKLIFQSSINKYMDIRIKKTEKYWKNLYQKIISKKKQFSDDLLPHLKIFSNDEYIYIYKKNNFIKAEALKNGSAWLNGTFKVSKEAIEVSESNNKNIFLCPKDIYKKGLTIRRWLYGDKFDLFNGKRKKVSDLFNENKINIVSKNKRPIILSNDRIEWIPGLAHSKNNYKEHRGLYMIKWIPNE